MIINFYHTNKEEEEENYENIWLFYVLWWGDSRYAPGVKKAIDEYVKKKNYKCEILHTSRFARIEKV